jgi:hypothetical protein
VARAPEDDEILKFDFEPWLQRVGKSNVLSSNDTLILCAHLKFCLLSLLG